MEFAESLILTSERKFKNENSISAMGSSDFPFPKIPEDSFLALLNVLEQRLKEQPTLLRINGDIVIVGDIHGNLHDLYRILLKAGNPSETKYLFLGDYVDRGSHSVECLAYIAAITVLYPDNVHILRGNHELKVVNTGYGFRDQVMWLYNSDMVFKRANEVFEYLPLGAIINKDTFCVHGGISKYCDSISQIEQIKRPIEKCSMTEQKIVEDLLWSDPDEVALKEFEPNPRGKGQIFSESALETFLNHNDLKRCIRAHQFIKCGVQRIMRHMMYTIFSSSDYHPGIKSYAGALKVYSQGNLDKIILSPLSCKVRKSELMVYYNVAPRIELSQVKSGMMESPVFMRARLAGTQHSSIGQRLKQRRASTCDLPPLNKEIT